MTLRHLIGVLVVVGCVLLVLPNSWGHPLGLRFLGTLFVGCALALFKVWALGDRSMGWEMERASIEIDEENTVEAVPWHDRHAPLLWTATFTGDGVLVALALVFGLPLPFALGLVIYVTSLVIITLQRNRPLSRDD